jgi:hypothetical protein
VAAADLPRAFAVATAYGDAASALVGLAAALALRYRPAVGVGLAWLYTMMGLADLANALTQVVLHQVQPAHFGATWLLPTINVPALIVAHLVIVSLLLRRARRPGPSAAAATR